MSGKNSEGCFPVRPQRFESEIEEKSSQLQMMTDKCERLEECLADKERKIIDLEKRLKHSEGKKLSLNQNLYA